MTFLDRDFAEWTADPAFEACTHPEGRAFPNPLVREFLRALGVQTCPRCGQATAILGPRRHRR